MKTDKMLYIIYADFETLIKKIDVCANNLQMSSATKIGEIILCGYPIWAIWASFNIENKHNLYHWEYCMKKVLYFPERTCYKCNKVWKEQNVIEKGVRTTLRYSSLLHLWEKNC